MHASEAHICLHKSACTHVHTFTYTYACNVYAHTCICTDMCMHRHVHICSNVLNKSEPHRLIYLKAYSSGSVTTWEDQEMWPCWRKYISLGADFEISKAHTSPVSSSSCCLHIQMQTSQLLLQHQFCLCAAVFPAMMIKSLNLQASPVQCSLL